MAENPKDENKKPSIFDEDLVQAPNTQDVNPEQFEPIAADGATNSVTPQPNVAPQSNAKASVFDDDLVQAPAPQNDAVPPPPEDDEDLGIGAPLEVHQDLDVPETASAPSAPVQQSAPAEQPATPALTPDSSQAPAQESASQSNEQRNGSANNQASQTSDQNASRQVAGQKAQSPSNGSTPGYRGGMGGMGGMGGAPGPLSSISPKAAAIGAAAVAGALAAGPVAAAAAAGVVAAAGTNSGKKLAKKAVDGGKAVTSKVGAAAQAGATMAAGAAKVGVTSPMKVVSKGLDKFRPNNNSGPAKISRAEQIARANPDPSVLQRFMDEHPEIMQERNFATNLNGMRDSLRESKAAARDYDYAANEFDAYLEKELRGTRVAEIAKENNTSIKDAVHKIKGGSITDAAAESVLKSVEGNTEYQSRHEKMLSAGDNLNSSMSKCKNHADFLEKNFSDRVDVTPEVNELNKIANEASDKKPFEMDKKIKEMLKTISELAEKIAEFFRSVVQKVTSALKR